MPQFAIWLGCLAAVACVALMSWTAYSVSHQQVHVTVRVPAEPNTVPAANTSPTVPSCVDDSKPTQESLERLDHALTVTSLERVWLRVTRTSAEKTAVLDEGTVGPGWSVTLFIPEDGALDVRSGKPQGLKFALAGQDIFPEERSRAS